MEKKEDQKGKKLSPQEKQALYERIMKYKIKDTYLKLSPYAEEHGHRNRLLRRHEWSKKQLEYEILRSNFVRDILTLYESEGKCIDDPEMIIRAIL